MQMSENSLGLDLSKAIDIAQSFYQVSDVNVTVIDSSANMLCKPQTDYTFCSRFCHDSGSGINCNNVRLYGSYQAERFGGKYIFFCPMGLVLFASPLSIQGITQAAFVGGPVMMSDPDEYILEDISMQRRNISHADMAEIRLMLNEIPRRGPVKTRHLSELLFAAAAFVCGGGKDYYSDTQDKEKLQSNISDYIQKLKGEDINAYEYPIKKEKELIHSIASGDKKRSQMLLNEILGHIFFSSGGTFEVIRARVLELVVILSRAALDGGADVEQIFGLSYKYLNEIHNFKTVEDLAYWLSRLMIRFTDCVFNLVDIKHVDVIYKAISFIRENYADKLTLEKVAGQVHLSPTYFSKIFKEEMRTAFNTYLNKVRIDNAKRLLLDDNISLVDISSLVGYQDQSYFSKVFKNVVGVSPGKYRELRGNIPQAESQNSKII